jgi:hypothetical protein
MKGWVNHEEHEGYDLGGFETRLKNLPVLQLRALRVFVVRSNSFYKIASVTVVIQNICASRENSQA